MSYLSGFGFGGVVRQPKARPAVAQEPPRGRRRKPIEVPCCEVCDCHFLTVRNSKSETNVRLVCTACGHAWRDTTREVMTRPRTRRGVTPHRPR